MRTSWANQFLKNWLINTACHPRNGHGKLTVHLVSKCRRYAMFKHAGHRDRYNSWDPKSWCPAFYVVFDVKLPAPTGGAACPRCPELWRYTGRLLPEHIRTAEKIVGQSFEKP